MKILSTILICLVAILHFCIMVLEMFFWDHPIGRDIFSMTEEQSASSAVLAMNQGLYNGFLAIGLVWGLVTNRLDIKVFFLLCVSVAGIFGSMTAKGSILYTQALPAIFTLLILYISNKNTE